MCFLVNFHFLGGNRNSASHSQKSPTSNTFRAGLGCSVFEGPHLPRLHHTLPLFILRHGRCRQGWAATPNNLEIGTRHSFPSCLDDNCCANNSGLCFHSPTLCEANQLIPVSKLLQTGAVRRARPRFLAPWLSGPTFHPTSSSHTLVSQPFTVGLMPPCGRARGPMAWTFSRLCSTRIHSSSRLGESAVR